jgi:hypothetical protein
MSTLAKPKKPARKAAEKSAELPRTTTIDPVSGLPVVKACSGQKPVTAVMVKAALADFP